MNAPTYANISQIDRNLWTGGDFEVPNPDLAAAQLAEVDGLGITNIVDCRSEWSDEEWVTAVAPHIGYHWLGVDDVGARLPDEWFDAGTSHILRCIEDGGTVLVHCHMGINRGPSMAFAALLVLGWDPVDALDRIRHRRAIAYVDYAQDALDWWQRRNGASAVQRRIAQQRVAGWRTANQLDVAAVIRRIRLREEA